MNVFCVCVCSHAYVHVHLCKYTQVHICFQGGVRGVMVSVVGNGHDDTGSN